LIYALFMRRVWLWKNRLISSIGIIFILPVLVYILITSSLKNILGQSLSGIPYEIWVIPGLIFIISSLGLFPLLYRDFFDLRVHKKVIVNVALAPYEKRNLVGSYIFVAGLEAMIMGLISIFVFAGFTQISLGLMEIFVLFSCLGLYLFLLGNLFISIALIIDTVTTLFLITAMIFTLIFFGNGFIIEFGFFSAEMEAILKWQPISIPFQIFQNYYRSGLFDWKIFSGMFALSGLWVIANGSILKRRLIH